MIVTDPIADMLTRIRNAQQAKHDSVIIPSSKEKLEIVKILKEEGYITDYTVDEETKSFVVTIKYGKNKSERVVTGLKRISKPGLRVYAQADKLPRVLNGLGIAIISTSKGIMTDKKARELHIGGEVVCYVW